MTTSVSGDVLPKDLSEEEFKKIIRKENVASLRQELKEAQVTLSEGAIYKLKKEELVSCIFMIRSMENQVSPVKRIVREFDSQTVNSLGIEFEVDKPHEGEVKKTVSGDDTLVTGATASFDTGRGTSVIEGETLGSVVDSNTIMLSMLQMFQNQSADREKERKADLERLEKERKADL